MYEKLSIPDYVADRINFALYPLNVQPSFVSRMMHIYTLHYKGGPTLTERISCIRYRKFFLFQKTRLWISVFEQSVNTPQDIHHLSRLLVLPRSANDMAFDVMLLSRFASMSRAVADILGAGECLTTKDAKHN